MTASAYLLARRLHAEMAKLTPDERLRLMGEVMDGFCKRCGYPLDEHRKCYCERDE